ISLGVKQMEGDPFGGFVSSGHDKGAIVTGTVKSLDAKGAVIALDGDVEAYLKASEVSADRVEDIRTHLKEGDTVKAVIINVDRKNRGINLSIKAMDKADTAAAMQKFAADNTSVSGSTNLGALLKAKMSSGKTDAQ
ncbi:MAG: S1 RNA-binding domain-containing protein, partial [Sideroxydans sp.]